MKTIKVGKITGVTIEKGDNIEPVKGGANEFIYRWLQHLKYLWHILVLRLIEK